MNYEFEDLTRLKKMKNTDCFYSLEIDPLHEFAYRIGAEVCDNKIVTIPKGFGEGYIYFLEVAPGVSVLFKNYKLSSRLTMNKLTYKEDFCLLHYNLEDLNAGRNLWIINKQIEDIYEPVVKEKVFSFDLFINKKTMLKLINELSGSKLLIEKINNDNGYYKDFIDNKSLILLLSLQKKHVRDPLLDFYTKGVTFKLLANFLEYNVN